jgi:hypothetical protein
LGWVSLAGLRRFYTATNRRSTACYRPDDSRSAGPEFTDASTLAIHGTPTAKRYANGPSVFPDSSGFKHAHSNQNSYPHRCNSDGNFNCGCRHHPHRDCSGGYSNSYSGANRITHSHLNTSTRADRYTHRHGHLNPAATHVNSHRYGHLYPDSSSTNVHADLHPYAYPHQHTNGHPNPD